MVQPSGVKVARILPQLHIDELLDELQGRLSSVRSSRDRVRQLLEAVVAIGAGLELETVLATIVRAATSLVDARYGALGVIGGDLKLSRFITAGMSQEQIAAIGAYPEGHGLLGELIRHPVPLRSEELGAHPCSYGLPANHPPMHSFLGVPVRVRGEVFGNLYLTEKSGGVLFDADDEAVLTALAAAAGVAIDNARLFEDAQRLYAEAQRRQEWLEITGELGRSLLSDEHTAGQVLEAFVRRVRAFTRADLALVAVPGADGAGLLVVAGDGEGAERLVGTVVGVESTLLGHVYKSGHSALVADVREDPRADRETMAAFDLGPALITPLGSGGAARGAVSLSRHAGAQPFDPALAELTSELAVQAAVVLELAQRRKDSELLSLYADRDRIGRDLHDLAIQRLFAISMALQTAYKVTEKPAAARRIAQSVTDLDETIKVIRSTIFSLHAHDLNQDAPSVRAEVITVCERAAAALGFPPSVRFTGPVDTLVPEQVAEHLLAVLREALSNAARHAHATTVEVDLSADTAGVSLTVADDGAGIPESGRRSGLSNLRERAEQLGGTFTATSRQAGGTALTWRVPALD
ncbi:MAG TPA: GAF domain-containing sensor histidine kinase [Actinocrinis sp.]|nr:GAF domain-containing sensor histidine kinase [Actinocrinis sp.]